MNIWYTSKNVQQTSEYESAIQWTGWVLRNKFKHFQYINIILKQRLNKQYVVKYNIDKEQEKIIK